MNICANSAFCRLGLTFRKPASLTMGFSTKNATGCSNLSTSCDKQVNLIKFKQICLNQACCNSSFVDLLKQLAASLWITSFGNQLTTSLLTTCDRLVVNKLSQAMRTHPHIGLLIVYESVVKFPVPTCAVLAV